MVFEDTSRVSYADVSDRLRILQANAVYDPAAKTPEALLDSYTTLTEWSAAMNDAGASVSVVQRFRTDAKVNRDGVAYEFVKDARHPWLSTSDAPKEFVEAIARHAPDVVHVNGLIFPQLVAAIRLALGNSTVVVAQHHGGEFPVRGSGLVGLWRRRQWRAGLSAADAFSFTAVEQADPWRAAEVIGPQRVLEIVEASTTIRTVPRERARSALGVSGDPVILWVGRLTTNKDPLTVIDGLEIAMQQLPGAKVVMVFGDDTLLWPVGERLQSSSLLKDRVLLAGRVPRDEMPNYYAAADVFVSGSHSEGSGYALIESMACGLVPVVTDIPAFRAIAGSCGMLWPPGDAGACAAALLEVCGRDLTADRNAVRERFDRELRWEAIARRTMADYRSLVEGKRTSS